MAICILIQKAGTIFSLSKKIEIFQCHKDLSLLRLLLLYFSITKPIKACLCGRQERFKALEKVVTSYYLFFVAVNPGTIDVSVPRLHDQENSNQNLDYSKGLED